MQLSMLVPSSLPSVTNSYVFILLLLSNFITTNNSSVSYMIYLLVLIPEKTFKLIDTLKTYRI